VRVYVYICSLQEQKGKTLNFLLCALKCVTLRGLCGHALTLSESDGH